MARIYKSIPTANMEQHADIEAVIYTGKNIEEVAEFVGYTPKPFDKYSDAIKIENFHGTFKLVPGKWVAKGEYQGKEVFFVMDNSTFVLRWNTMQMDIR